MLYNSAAFEKANSDQWVQQQSSKSNQQRIESPGQSQASLLAQQQHQQQMQQQQQQRPISPNSIYAALLHYHMQQTQHQQELMLQQQLRHESFLMAELNARNLHPSQQLQMIQQAAALAAAQQLTLKTNFNAKSKPSDDLLLDQKNKLNNLSSPASSTSSSSASLETIARTSSASSTDELSNMRVNSNTRSLKRPLLKFSMDAILGNEDQQSKAKRLCMNDLARHDLNELNKANNKQLIVPSLASASSSPSIGASVTKQQQQPVQLNNNTNANNTSNPLFPIGLGK